MSLSWYTVSRQPGILDWVTKGNSTSEMDGAKLSFIINGFLDEDA